MMIRQKRRQFMEGVQLKFFGQIGNNLTPPLGLDFGTGKLRTENEKFFENPEKMLCEQITVRF